VIKIKQEQTETLVAPYPGNALDHPPEGPVLPVQRVSVSKLQRIQPFTITTAYLSLGGKKPNSRRRSGFAGYDRRAAVMAARQNMASTM
jgi:hypothetical protein